MLNANASAQTANPVADLESWSKAANRSSFRAAWLLACCALILTSPPSLLVASSWLRHTIDASARGADGVRLGDLDGDGLLDVATGWEEAGIVRVCLNPGPANAKSPWPAVTVGAAPSVEDAAFFDVDGDGVLEIVSCCEGNSRCVRIHRWLPDGTRPVKAPSRSDLLDPERWQTRIVPVTNEKTMWMFVEELRESDRRHGNSTVSLGNANRESPLRLIVGSKGADAMIGNLTASSNPWALDDWKLRALRSAAWIMTLTTEDLDRDGDQDILFTDRKGEHRSLGWLENPGFTTTGQPLFWPEHRVCSPNADVMFADPISNPGRRSRWQIAVAVKPGSLLVWESEDRSAKAWNLRSQVEIPASFGGAKAVRLVDLNEDGTHDLVFSCESATGALSGVGWFPGTDNGRGFGRALDIGGPDGVKFDLIELLDLDGDGDLDVMTCEERDNLGVVWYENPLNP